MIDFPMTKISRFFEKKKNQDKNTTYFIFSNQALLQRRLRANGSDTNRTQLTKAIWHETFVTFDWQLSKLISISCITFPSPEIFHILKCIFALFQSFRVYYQFVGHWFSLDSLYSHQILVLNWWKGFVFFNRGSWVYRLGVLHLRHTIQIFGVTRQPRWIIIAFRPPLTESDETSNLRSKRCLRYWL